MNIVVLIKQVPDTYGTRRLDPQTGLTDRASAELVLDETSGRALEVALAHADEHPGTHITVVTLGPASAASALRDALAMGAHAAVHVTDESLVGADLTLTAEALAATARRAAFDLVITGDQSTDGASGLLPALLAEMLGLPHLTELLSVAIDGAGVAGVRAADGETVSLSAPLPAVISVGEALPEARYANFRGILSAKKKPLDTVGAGPLGVDAASAARSIVLQVEEAPARAAGRTIHDEGDGGRRLAEFLVAERLL